MQYAYLDFLQKLENLFSAIFTSVLEPILTEILHIFINFLINVVWNLLSELLIGIFIALCSILDFIEEIFNLFAGIDMVSISGKKQTTLLAAMFEMEDVSKAFLYITLMSVAICLVFTIYKTAKSISDMAMEDENPISKVLQDALKATVTFMLIPFICLFLLQLSSTVTKQVQTAFSVYSGETGSIGTIVFLSASMDADKDTMEKKDLLTGVMEPKENCGNRQPSFHTAPWKTYMENPTKYRTLSEVRGSFHVENFNYIAGITTAVILILLMGGAVLSFIRRIFELLLLYLVSPLYVSTIPLDDGAIFGRWRELFVAKFFSGFGTIFAMKYYLMIVPFLTSSNLTLYNVTGNANDAMIDTVLRVFLIIGGAWAVYKGQLLIMMILAPDAAMTEQQAGSFVTGMFMGGASKVTLAASSAISKARSNQSTETQFSAKSAKSLMQQYKSLKGMPSATGKGGNAGDKGGSGDPGGGGADGGADGGGDIDLSE